MLIDSAEVELSDWIRMASDIERNYSLFDSFVVLHGTDSEHTSRFDIELETQEPLLSNGVQRIRTVVPPRGPWVRRLGWRRLMELTNWVSQKNGTAGSDLDALCRF